MDALVGRGFAGRVGGLGLLEDSSPGKVCICEQTTLIAAVGRVQHQGRGSGGRRRQQCLLVVLGYICP